MITGELEVEDVGYRSVVMDEGGKAVGVVGAQRKFAEDRPGRLAGRWFMCVVLNASSCLRGEKGSRLPNTSPSTRRRVSFADVRSSVPLFHASLGFSGD